MSWGGADSKDSTVESAPRAVFQAVSWEGGANVFFRNTFGRSIWYREDGPVYPFKGLLCTTLRDAWKISADCLPCVEEKGGGCQGGMSGLSILAA